MIIMLNGSFGAGKSSVASVLVRIIPRSMIYDPEVVGTCLRYITDGVRAPHEETGDFQDISLWPALTVVTAEHLYKQYKRTLIVPMTIANPQYLDTIRNGLAAISPPLYHFCLTAPLDTLEQRLKRREEDTSWARKKAREYAPLFVDSRYSVHIDAGEATVDQVAQQIKKYIADNAEAPNPLPV